MDPNPTYGYRFRGGGKKDWGARADDEPPDIDPDKRSVFKGCDGIEARLLEEDYWPKSQEFFIARNKTNSSSTVSLQEQAIWPSTGNETTADISGLSKSSTDQEYSSPLVDLEALSGKWQIFLTILYSLTAVTSFVLNVLTVIVLARIRRSELRRYLINLSVSDLIMSLFSIRK